MKTILELRLDRDMSAPVVAEAIGTTPPSIYAWERLQRRPSDYFMKLLAEFFETPVEQIKVAPFRKGGHPFGRPRGNGKLVTAS